VGHFKTEDLRFVLLFGFLAVKVRQHPLPPRTPAAEKHELRFNRGAQPLDVLVVERSVAIQETVVYCLASV